MRSTVNSKLNANLEVGFAIYEPGAVQRGVTEGAYRVSL